MNKLRKKKRKKIKPFELKKINEQSIDRYRTDPSYRQGVDDGFDEVDEDY